MSKNFQDTFKDKVAALTQIESADSVEDEDPQAPR